jgi:hypothetical protein
MSLGFDGSWDRNPHRTWSDTPWDLSEVMTHRSDVEIADVGATLPTVPMRVLQLAAVDRLAVKGLATCGMGSVSLRALLESANARRTIWFRS